MSIVLKTPSNGSVTLAEQDTASDVTVTIPAVTATMLNDQSNIEAQSKTALNASGSAPIYACRAWVNFNGTGTVAIRASGNVSSITDSGVGQYFVNFTTAMQDTSYCAVGAFNWNNNGNQILTFVDTVSRAFVGTLEANTYVDRTTIQAAIFR